MVRREDLLGMMDGVSSNSATFGFLDDTPKAFALDLVAMERLFPRKRARLATEAGGSVVREAADFLLLAPVGVTGTGARFRLLLAVAVLALFVALAVALARGVLPLATSGRV